MTKNKAMRQVNEVFLNHLYLICSLRINRLRLNSITNNINPGQNSKHALSNTVTTGDM